MATRRVVLIEYVDAAGAAAHDLRARASALQRAGCSVRGIVVDAARVRALQPPPPPTGSTLHLSDDAGGRGAMNALLADLRPDYALVACAAHGGGEVGRWLARSGRHFAWWWPTGVAGAHGRTRARTRDRATPSGSVGLPVLPGLVSADAASGPGALPGIEAGVCEGARTRRVQLPLWDGDYLLALTPLEGEPGRRALEGFAHLCAAHEGLDLVVLADPQPAFERLARRLGVGLRVHFVGEAPSDAERAWLRAAVAAIVAGDAPIAGGRVLRALAYKCPLLPVRGGEVGDRIAAWLARVGAGVGDVGADLFERVTAVVEERETVATAVAAGAERARCATVEELGERLAEAFHQLERPHRAA